MRGPRRQEMTLQNLMIYCGYPCIIESCTKTFNFHNKNSLCLVCKKGRTGAESWKILKRTDGGEMTVPLLQTIQVMLSFGEVQSCKENAYIIRGSGLA